MSSTLKKRKIVDSHYAGRPVQPTVANFGRVSKSGVGLLNKKAAVFLKPCSLDDPQKSFRHQPKKRKLELPRQSHQKPARTDSDLKLSKKQNCPATVVPLPTPLSKPRKIAPLKSKSTSKALESPTQGARAILEAFVIATPRDQSKSVASRTSTEQCSFASINLPTPCHLKEGLPSLPPDLQDLVELHSAFLSALSLHYAHNGTSSPADLRILRPTIGRIWGRRKVEVVDIQRILGIQQWTPALGAQHAVIDYAPTLALCDFGMGKICIEYEAAVNTAATSHTEPLPTATLRAKFNTNVQALHRDHDSLADFPLARVTCLTSEPSLNPTLPSKALQHLFAIKAGALSAQISNAISTGLQPSPHIAHDSSTSTTKPASRGASLLDRIRAKETLAASQPDGTSPEARARRTALFRLEEAIPVIESLVAGSRSGAVSAGSSYTPDMGFGPAIGLGLASSQLSPVISLTMTAFVRHIQNSLKQPISHEEAERCVKLLAKEVLPQWIQIREVGRVVGVTVRGKLVRSTWFGKLRELVELEEHRH